MKLIFNCFNNHKLDILRKSLRINNLAFHVTSLGPYAFYANEWIPLAVSKETTLERDGFSVQILVFVTWESERVMFKIYFLSSFRKLLSPRFQSRAD